MIPLTKITHGFIGSGDITVDKYYELPIQVDIDYGDIEVENLMEREISLTVEVE